MFLGSSSRIARRLIDATGRRAVVARSLGATRSCDDAFVALYAWARPVAGDHDTRTLIEAESDGWWYTAKLPDATRVVVPHVDRENASAIFHTAGEWEARLGRTSHISQTLAGASFEGPPRGAEACGARLDRFSGEGWAAAGDAALHLTRYPHRAFSPRYMPEWEQLTRLTLI